MPRVESIDDFAKVIYDLQASDNDVILGVGGMTGSGKSALISAIHKAHGKVAGIPWDYSRMTWNRNELMTWVDGKPKSEPDPKTGLKPGQLPMYSSINCDEIFLMFYKRNWNDDKQIKGLATLNMFRDRRLLLSGLIPNFWDLDPGFLKRVRFYIYVKERGIAWVFEQSNNPFNADPWNSNRNRKTFDALGNPYKLPNFIMELHFPDWAPKEKEIYYRIRNAKRIKAVQHYNEEKADKYKDIRLQRDRAIRAWIEYTQLMYDDLKLRKAFHLKKLTYVKVADTVGISNDYVKDIFFKRS